MMMKSATTERLSRGEPQEYKKDWKSKKEREKEEKKGKEKDKAAKTSRLDELVTLLLRFLSKYHCRSHELSSRKLYISVRESRRLRMILFLQLFVNAIMQSSHSLSRLVQINSNSTNNR